MEPLVPRCYDTKADGHICRRIIGQPGRCGIHSRTYNKTNPREYVYREIKYRTKRMLRSWRLLLLDPEIVNDTYRRILEWSRVANMVFLNMTDERIVDLISGRGSWFIHGYPEPIGEDGFIVPPVPRLIQRQQAIDDLGHFVQDKQNVHLTVTVKQTIDIVNRVLKIPVPPEYRWNTETLSKTPGEIIVFCKLTPQAGAVMTDKYSRDDDVYELGKGIYGKVLDSVWQYISKSDDKENMCAILKQELQDNIGMCAQGNLSRLCNALAGYMEGVGEVESPAEKLGRLIPPLMEIEDVKVRIEKVKELLADVNLPRDEWDNWLSACS